MKTNHLVALVWSIVFFTLASGSPSLHATTLLNDKQRAIVVQLQADGVVKIDVKLSKVWIDPIEWITVDAAGKQQLATLFAGYVWDANPDSKSIEIFDKQSAKRLARFGRMGFQAD
ncbi:MAG: hypothetical protein H2172_12500 [Opitutus sp.]|nr:hypothetical protein [Opitutus sp.]MCS6248700.1 hypothetical protein [Opitutus sp.]MCS6275568.1 hypothetical protein [Opitutus sp.]MCS6275913.1 hypothetical protein [Opitutus sp.]MCS6301010.1 hypothetical protein [Opitutus sp.]